MKEHIELIVREECGDHELIDFNGTINAIHDYCQSYGLYEIAHWTDSENLALLVLEWLGMHEAIWKQL